WDEALANTLVQAYKLPILAKVKALSKGMAPALGVIVGLASNALLTIFDEQSIGLDAAARKKLYDMLPEHYDERPRTIIFSTNMIDEVSILFEEVLIIQDGELILQEKAEMLRENAYSVTGTKEEVEAFIQNKHVMKTKQLANMMTAYIFGSQ